MLMGIIVSLVCLCLSAIEMVEDGAFVVPPRKTSRKSHARSLRPPMRRHSRSMGWLEGSPPTLITLEDANARS